jgi:hypothetical protein
MLLATLATVSVLMCVATPIAHATVPIRPTPAAKSASDAGAPSTVVPHKGTYPANIEFDPGGYGTYNQAALTDPTIGAVDINLNWYQVEPQSGAFNFAPADQEVAAWAADGKKVTLELRFQHEANVPGICTSDGWLPPWVAASIPTLCEKSNGNGLVVPDYLSQTFQSDWRKYVATVAGHFANGPYKADVTYVRVALGLGAESFPLEPCYNPAAQGCSEAAYEANVQKLQAWGYTASSWLRWQEGLLAYYKGTFTYTTVIYPINQMLSPTSNRLNINPATGHPIEMDVAYWAAARGIGLGQEGLDGPYAKDYAKFNEISAYVWRHYPDTYLQFQTVSEVSNKGTSTCSAACLFQEDVRAAEHYHARSIEWYAADDANPAFQPFLDQWQKYVNG